MNFKEYKRITDKYPCVSFDIFDTLIRRDVTLPTDIFTIVGKHIAGKNLAEKFHDERIKMEILAREKSNTGEVTLQDIYYEMTDGPFDHDNQLQYLMEDEIRTEIEHCYPVDRMADFFCDCLKRGKRVILISDMYLPEETIRQMLEKCGITGYKSLYISNVYACDKISGRLFNVALRKEHLHKNQIIHIGDSIKADYLGARKMGIKSILIRRPGRLHRLLRH